MRKHNLTIVLLSLVCLFSVPYSCIFALENTTTQPANVYFIHPPETSQQIYLFANHQFLTLLKSNTYFLADLNPGLNTIWFDDGKKTDLLNVFEFVPGRTYYLEIGDHGYHSILNEIEGLQLFKRVQTAASYDKKAEKRASEILKKFSYHDDVSQLTDLHRIPANSVLNDTPNLVKIPRFAPIKLIFVNDLSLDNIKTNDLIEFQVSEDVIINNKVVILQGTIVKGQILMSLTPQKLGYPGFIDIIIPNIEVNDDTKIPVVGRYIQSGVSKERTVKNIRKVGFAAILFGPAEFNAIFLESLLLDSITSGIKGQKKTISRGAEFTVWTRYDTYEVKVSNRNFLENNIGERLKTQIPSEAIFPDVHAPLLVDSLKAYEILFKETNKYKIGNAVSPQVYYAFKAAVYQRSDLSNTPAFTCAKEASGYYLQVDLNISSFQTDKGTFTLIDPKTSDSICKVEVKEAFGWSYDDSAKKLLKKGIKKLWRELKKIGPSLIKE